MCQGMCRPDGKPDALMMLISGKTNVVINALKQRDRKYVLIQLRTSICESILGSYISHKLPVIEKLVSCPAGNEINI
jgi:formylmethanofuran:tetrahydromethanopterin formyltransferase